jgi:hypothetical protein
MADDVVLFLVLVVFAVLGALPAGWAADIPAAPALRRVRHPLDHGRGMRYTSDV